jgi:hypothetical protein
MPNKFHLQFKKKFPEMIHPLLFFFLLPQTVLSVLFPSDGRQLRLRNGQLYHHVKDFNTTTHRKLTYKPDQGKYFRKTSYSAPIQLWDPNILIKDILGPVVFETVARFENCTSNKNQQIFEFQHFFDAVRLGQIENTYDIEFEIVRDGEPYRIIAPSAIRDGEIATWRAGVDKTGYMWIEKDGVRQAVGQGVVPLVPRNRYEKRIGRSLKGAVLGMSVTNDGYPVDNDLLNTIPTISGPFIIRFYARFDSLRNDTMGNQTIFDFGNGINSDNIVCGQSGNLNTFVMRVYVGYENKVTLSARRAIIVGEMAFWRVGVDADGTAWIEKNGARLATVRRIQGSVPRDIIRKKNYIGESSWPDSTKLNGVVLGLRLDN